MWKCLKNAEISEETNWSTIPDELLYQIQPSKGEELEGRVMWGRRTIISSWESAIQSYFLFVYIVQNRETSVIEKRTSVKNVYCKL